MRKYTKPSMEVVEIAVEDIIQTSGLNFEKDGDSTNGDFSGGGASGDWGQPANL